MNKFIPLLIATALTTTLAAPLARAETTTLKVDLDGLVCAFCAQGVEKKMKAQPETAKVYVSLEKKVALVALKDGKDIADERIRTQITDAGYLVKGISRSTEPFDTLKARIKEGK